jgi:hypothetical protein
MRSPEVSPQKPNTEHKNEQSVLGLRIWIDPLVGPPTEKRNGLDVTKGRIAKKLENQYSGERTYGSCGPRMPVGDNFH